MLESLRHFLGRSTTLKFLENNIQKRKWYKKQTHYCSKTTESKETNEQSKQSIQKHKSNNFQENNSKNINIEQIWNENNIEYKEEKRNENCISIYLAKYSFSCVVDLGYTHRSSFDLHFIFQYPFPQRSNTCKPLYMYIDLLHVCIIYSIFSSTILSLFSYIFFYLFFHLCLLLSWCSKWFFFYSFEIQFLISPSFKHFIHICNDTKRINVCHLGTLFQIKCELVMPHS